MLDLPRHSLVKGSAAVLALVFLAACSGEVTPGSLSVPSGTTTGAAALSPGPARTGDVTDGPMWTVMSGGADFVSVQIASETRINRAVEACLTDLGFPPITLQGRPRALVSLDRVTALLGTRVADRKFRETHGYGVTSNAVGIPRLDDQLQSLDTFKNGMSEAQSRAFDSAFDKCFDAARRTTFSPAYDQMGRDLAEVAAKVMADPRVLNAISAWRSCMAERGFAVSTFDDPPAQMERRLFAAQDSEGGLSDAAARTLHADELSMAAADWGCLNTRYTPVFFAVRDEAETAYLEAHPDLAAQVSAEVAAMLAAG